MPMYVCCCDINLGSVAELLTCFLAIFAFTISYKEYRNHKKRERISILTQLSERYASDPNISSVVRYLEDLEDKKINSNPPDIHQIELFMRFFEEVSCLMNAKSVKDNIVYYMFGHYVLLFADNIDKFPKELEYDKGFWILFRRFVERMKKAKAKIYCYNTKENKVDEYKIKEKEIEL